MLLFCYKDDTSVDHWALQGRKKLPHDIKRFAAAEWFDQQLRVLESVQYYSGGQYNGTTG